LVLYVFIAVLSDSSKGFAISQPSPISRHHGAAIFLAVPLMTEAAAAHKGAIGVVAQRMTP
jgi:hypothetical protein